jgi:carotenoid cleavage dioxygenase
MEHGLNDLGNQAVLWQWTIDTVSGNVKEEQLDDQPADFPRIDDRRVGLEARFGYLAGLRDANQPDFANTILKYDLADGGVTTHTLRGSGSADAVHGYEPVFAPAATDAGEDEGWLLVLSHDDTDDVTTLNVLDAQDLAADPVARVRLPQRVPFGAHGNWLPDH